LNSSKAIPLSFPEIPVNVTLILTTCPDKLLPIEAVFVEKAPVIVPPHEHEQLLVAVPELEKVNNVVGKLTPLSVLNVTTAEYETLVLLFPKTAKSPEKVKALLFGTVYVKRVIDFTVDVFPPQASISIAPNIEPVFPDNGALTMFAGVVALAVTSNISLFPQVVEPDALPNAPTLGVIKVVLLKLSVKTVV